jgi:hypothetical protein
LRRHAHGGEQKPGKEQHDDHAQLFDSPMYKRDSGMA